MVNKLRDKRQWSEYPEMCVTYVEESDTLAVIRRGEQGLIPFDASQAVCIGEKMYIKTHMETLDQYARRINDDLGVDEEMETDMVGCSMFDQWPMKTIPIKVQRPMKPIPLKVNLMPNIDTPEKVDRLEELCREKEAADFEVVRFCVSNRSEIWNALNAVSVRAGDDQGLEDLFDRVLREQAAAVDRMQYFAARGEERSGGE